MKQKYGAMDFGCNGWQIENDFLSKAFKFADFKMAMNFVQGVGLLADKSGRCPEILVHSCSSVEVFLRSHDVNDVTNEDYHMARQIDNLVYTEDILAKLH